MGKLGPASGVGVQITLCGPSKWVPAWRSTTSCLLILPPVALLPAPSGTLHTHKY